MTAVIRTKAELVANYRNQLNSNLSDALDGLMIVFHNQRDDEIATDSTHHKNHIGFNKSDAKVLSQIAKSKLDGKDLDDRQISEVSRRMPKYSWQIITSKIHNGQFVKRDGVYIRIQ
jgi:hypothetical protein